MTTTASPQVGVWLAQFNEAFAAWIESAWTDAQALDGVVTALRHVLEYDPEMGVTVGRLAATALHQSPDDLPGDQRVALAEIGMAAVRLQAGDDIGRHHLRAYLAAERGRGNLRADRPLQAVRDAAEAMAALDDEDSTDPASVGPYLRLRALALEAGAQDRLLDLAGALEAYRAGDELATAIVDSQDRFGSTLFAVVPFLYGMLNVPEEAVRAEMQLLWRELSGIRIHTAIGITRCLALDQGRAKDRQLSTAIANAAAAMRAHGVGGLAPFDLLPIVRRASPDDAEAFITAAVESAEAVGVSPDEFGAVLWAAASRAAGPRRAVARDAARAATARCDDPLVVAAAIGLLYAAAAGQPGAPTDVTERDFLDALGSIESGDARLDDPWARAAFDDAVAVALAHRARAVRRDDDPEDRRLLARLVDFDLAGRSILDRWLPTEGRPSDGHDLDTARALAEDRLGRLERALRDREGTTALIIRDTGPSTMFLFVSGGGRLAIAEDLKGAFREAATALVTFMDVQLQRLSVGARPPDPAKVQPLGNAAYNALPAPVRRALASATTVLVCPDLRTGGDAIPYELLHDGTAWLGTTRIVARYPSLRLLVRGAEGTARRDAPRRCLALAVPEVPLPDLEPLRYAAGEAEASRATLEARGWDAPLIEPARITASFLVDRLPLVAHMHLASHGVASGLDEELLLAAGATLTAGDLAGRAFPRFPTAFINACQVGRTRWIGGGTSRGIAQSFLEAGAPAVIANLLPVEDKRSAGLAERFYAASAEGSVGDALRRSRAEVAADESPVFWGSTVLIGDPSTTLEPDPGTRPLTDRLLEATIGVSDDLDPAATREEAMAALARADEDPRLAAAVALLAEMASWGAEPGPDLRPRIADACRVAVELDHLPTAAMSAFVYTELLDDSDPPDEVVDILDGAIRLVEPLEHESDTYARILNRLLARWMLLRQGDRAAALQVRGTDADSEEAEMLELGEAVRDAGLVVEARKVRREAAVTSISAEGSSDDVLWNAITARTTLDLETMPEVSGFARQLTTKLVDSGDIDATQADLATTPVTGLLKWLWDSQSWVTTAAELMQGQAGTLRVLLASIRSSWPPAPAPWFDLVADYPDRVQGGLEALDALPYDERLTAAIGDATETASALGIELIDRVAAAYPERRPDAAAWVQGTLIQQNTFSYIDGSVPEEIGDRMDQAYAAVAARGEGDFFPWLSEGFTAQREREPDELERWLLERPG